MKYRIEEIAARTRIGKVLDVGCSDGQLSQCIYEKGEREVFGIDIDGGKVAQSVASFPNVSFLQASAESIPFPDNYFDTVVAAELLEHLGKNQGKVLSEIQRVSKGHMVWSLPIGDYWLDEATHQWVLNGTAISHHTQEGIDDCVKTPLYKHIIVLEWIRKRWLTDK
jgi:ubiquinone/menaquinone biosynthesis C-methylase UbiE